MWQSSSKVTIHEAFGKRMLTSPLSIADRAWLQVLQLCKAVVHICGSASQKFMHADIKTGLYYCQQKCGLARILRSRITNVYPFLLGYYFDPDYNPYLALENITAIEYLFLSFHKLLYRRGGWTTKEFQDRLPSPSPFCGFCEISSRKSTGIYTS